MRIRTAVIAFAAVALLATGLRAQQQISPREIWPQATTAAREGDLDGAAARMGELQLAGRSFGIRTFPTYASSATGLASESIPANPELAAWARKASALLDGSSPSVAFNEADIAARRNNWGPAFRSAMQGYARLAGNYRTKVLSRADLLIVISMAAEGPAIIVRIAM